MTVLNRHLMVFTALFLAIFPAFAQESGESAEEYLRRAAMYHSNYEFTKAEEYYTKASGLTADSVLKQSIMDKILQCRNGESLLQYIARPAAVTSQTFSITDFFLYLQDMDNRSWLPLPNPFIQPAEGQSNPYYSAMYMPAGQNTVIFSAPDDSGAWSIYISSRTDSISWSAPELLSSSITSGHNEIFPVLSNDGNTLYFASDGLPGMGGYDLFKTVRDEETGEWGMPENLGFPYSSTGNDILFMDSRDGRYSIIASDRETSGTDSVKIYVTEYIATPVRTGLRDDESPLAVASFIKEDSGKQETSMTSPSASTENDTRMADYSRLMRELHRLQNELQDKLDKIKESRSIYNTASGDDKEFIAGIIREVEEESMQIRRKMDSISEQVRQIETRFLADGIIPAVDDTEEDIPLVVDTGAEEYIFSRHAMGKIPYIKVEKPEPAFDYTFKILGRDEGQFIEDFTMPDGVVYQIQFMVLTEHAEVRDIRGMSPVFVTKMQSGKYLHATGLFSTYQEASSSLSRVRKNGFPEAFIIAYNNGRSIPVKTARSMEEERVLSVTSGSPGTGSTKRPPSSTKSGEISYQVVITGYGSTLPATIISAIREACAKDITKSGSDDETVFAVGPFSKQDEAESLLRTLQDLDIKNVSIESINL